MKDGSLPESIVVAMPVADIETTTMPANGPERPQKRQDREKAAMRLRKAGWSYRRIAEALAVPYIMIGRWLSGDSAAERVPAASPVQPPPCPARPPEPEPVPEPEPEAETETGTKAEVEVETPAPAPEDAAPAKTRPAAAIVAAAPGAPPAWPTSRAIGVDEGSEDLDHQVTVLKLQFSAFDKYVQDVIARFEKDRKDLMRRQNAALDKLEAGKTESEAARAKAEAELKEMRAEIEALRAESETFHDEVRQKLKSTSGGSGKSGGGRFGGDDDEEEGTKDDDADGEDPKDDDADDDAEPKDDDDADDFKFDVPDMDDDDDEPPKAKGRKRRSPF